MKPEDRKRLKQHIEMIVEHKMPAELSSMGKIKRALTVARLADVGCELSRFDVIELTGFIADMENEDKMWVEEHGKMSEMWQDELRKYRQLTDEFYLLLVDNPETKLMADKIMVNIFGKRELSESDVSMTQDVLTDIKTWQSIEGNNCIWVELDDPDIVLWATSCGNEFHIEDGKPSDNHMKFCCYCGKEIVEG